MADGNMALLHTVGRTGMRHNNLKISLTLHGAAVSTKQGNALQSPLLCCMKAFATLWLLPLVEIPTRRSPSLP